MLIIMIGSQNGKLIFDMQDTQEILYIFQEVTATPQPKECLLTIQKIKKYQITTYLESQS